MLAGAVGQGLLVSLHPKLIWCAWSKTHFHHAVGRTLSMAKQSPPTPTGKEGGREEGRKGEREWERGKEGGREDTVVKPSSLVCVTYKTKPVDNLPIDFSGIS